MSFISQMTIMFFGRFRYFLAMIQRAFNAKIISKTSDIPRPVDRYVW